MNNKAIISILCIALAAFMTFSYFLYRENNVLSAERDSLYIKVEKYEKTDGSSFVVSRISKQMEDIAYQQMEISNKRREEALFQMTIADQMRSKAESEQRKAQEFAENAAEARNMAEQQRELAVVQQKKAEYARNIADTLSFIALGRSLASLSSTQYLAGNKETSALLAYASWKFTTDFHGNINTPEIFNALSQNSGSFSSETLHKGGVSRIAPYIDNSYISVSRYGEIVKWMIVDEKWMLMHLLGNSSYNFRDICTDKDGIAYALSFDGMLLSVANDIISSPVVLPERVGWQRAICFGKNQLLLSSSRNIYIFNTVNRTVTKTIPIEQAINAIGMRGEQCLVFGKGGKLWTVSKDGSKKEEDLFVKGNVSAFTWLEKDQLGAIGMENGNICLVDRQNNIKGKLVGHSSKITDLCFNGNFLFSSSYDRVVNMWNTVVQNSEPVSLHNYSSWVYCLYNDEKNSIYVGDESGMISKIIVSPSEMAERIHGSLKSDLTREQWEYYVGKNIPQIKLKN